MPCRRSPFACHCIQRGVLPETELPFIRAIPIVPAIYWLNKNEKCYFEESLLVACLNAINAINPVAEIR